MPVPSSPTLAAPEIPVRFPEELPISACIRDIAAKVQEHRVVIVAGETGSGKTTQLPKMCLAMGRGLSARIAVTQPRRIAATSVAGRVASELGVQLGREVGYQIRFNDRTTRATYVSFMTDGILLSQLKSDPDLRGYDTIVIDEAHERSLNIDLLLGYAARLVERRADLRVIVSSATLETERFSAFFGGAPVVRVSGRTYPVEVVYRPPTVDEEGDLAEAIANTVEEITAIDPRGDILVFLPGEREIMEAHRALSDHALPHTTLLPLFGRLSQADQAKVFQPIPGRRVILATNVAETSLTIPGVVYVIDAGLARVNRYNPRTGVTQLLVEPISRASADQRKGRAGRTQGGVCFRLYEEKDYEARAAFTDPELLRVGLAGAILHMKALGLGDLSTFPFMDPPSKRAVDEGYRVLDEVGALDDDGELTEVGRRLAKLPVDPRVGRMVLAAEAEGCLAEVLVVAAVLGLQDPRERPPSDVRRADDAHRRYRDESSDFLTLLRLYRSFESEIAPKSQAQQRKLCRDRYLSYVRMREWTDVHEQLLGIVREMGLDPRPRGAKADSIHRAIMAGLLSRVGMWNAEHRVYVGARQTRFVLHPSSTLAKRPPPWVVAAEIVETSQLFARTAAKIEPDWLEPIAGRLAKKTYGEAHFSEKGGRAMIREHVTLYGLPVSKDRQVPLAPIDPRAARELFILHALVRGELRREGPIPAYVAHNEAVFEKARALRDRARKSEVLASDEVVTAFFAARVPAQVVDRASFERFRAERERDDPRALFLSLSDVLGPEAEELRADRYPDSIRIEGCDVPLTYRFDPSEDDDGATATVPLALVPALDAALFDWTIPAWLPEKIRWLLLELPRRARKEIAAEASVGELAALIAGSLTPFATPFAPAVCRALFELTGVTVQPHELELRSLPPHFSINVRVAAGEKIIAEGRDVGALLERTRGRALDAWAERGEDRWERRGVTSFGDPLPDFIEVEVAGARVRGYPALAERDGRVDRVLLPSRSAARREHRAGVRALALAALGTSAAKLEEKLPSRIASSALGDLRSPRRVLAARATDEVLGLAADDALPKDATDLQQRVERARKRLPVALEELGAAASAIAVELDAVRASLRALRGSAGVPREAIADIESQLATLVTLDLLASAPRDRLAQIPRYLRAIHVRLSRIPLGPQKDRAKAQSVVPFFTAWLAERERHAARGERSEALEAFRWLIEEQRVAVFASELKTPVPVSEKRLKEAWAAMTGSEP